MDEGQAHFRTANSFEGDSEDLLAMGTPAESPCAAVQSDPPSAPAADKCDERASTHASSAQQSDCSSSIPSVRQNTEGSLGTSDDKSAVAISPGGHHNRHPFQLLVNLEDCKYPVMRVIQCKLGWIEVDNDDERGVHLIWTDTSAGCERLSRLRPPQVSCSLGPLSCPLAFWAMRCAQTLLTPLLIEAALEPHSGHAGAGTQEGASSESAPHAGGHVAGSAALLL